VADVSTDRSHVLAVASNIAPPTRGRIRPLRAIIRRAFARRRIAVRVHGVKTRLLLTGAGSAATSNLIRSLRAGYRSLTIVGCHSGPLLLKKSSADRNYLVPALAHPGTSERSAA